MSYTNTPMRRSVLSTLLERANHLATKFGKSVAISLICSLFILVQVLTANARDDGAQTQRVQIDILPGVAPNNIDLDADDFLPVAILSTAGFDAASVDLSTLALAGTVGVKNENGEPSTTADVNEDGLADLVVYFPSKLSGLNASSTEATLTGRLSDGTPIEGADSVACTGGGPQAFHRSQKSETGLRFGFTAAFIVNPFQMTGYFETFYNYIASYFAPPAPLVTTTTTTYSNTSTITIPQTGTIGKASPYPSNINVSGATGTIDKVTVKFDKLSHTAPPDLDILLVGPAGQTVILMSDVGSKTGSLGSRRINNNDYVFDDSASASMTSATPASGTYRPTNIGGGDAFDAPAPSAPYGSTLSVFNGTNPNGTWSLFVMDDEITDAGAMNDGWSITITTTAAPTDTVAPVTNASSSGTAGTNGWFTSNVSVALSATDGAPTGVSPSGVNRIEYRFGTAGPFTTYTASFNVSTEGTNTIQYRAVDNAGNTETTKTLEVKIDKTAPAVSFGAANPAANGAGWNNTNVSVPFTITDATSGVASLSSTASPLTLSTEGASVSGSVTAVDQAGNSATLSSPSFKIDKTAPSLAPSRSPSANANGWNNTDVTASYNASDSLSGLASPATGSHNFTSEGANQSHTFNVSDVAGNMASVAVGNVNIDKTSPLVAAQRDTAANSHGWNNSDVQLSYTATDALSGVDLPASDSSPHTLTGEGANQSHQFTVADKAGNQASATVSGVNIDKTGPVISASRAPAANAHGWNNSDVTASAIASDALSGIDAGASTLSDVVFNVEGMGFSATFTAVDLAGNSASDTVSDINIDVTAPSIAAQRDTAANSNGWNNTDVQASYTASDALSGLDSPASGSHTFNVEAANQSHQFIVKDKAGNEASDAVSGVNIDKTAPTINATRSPSANANGWNNANVTASYTASDALSGLASGSPSTGSHLFSAEGAGQSTTFSVADLAGNNASATVSDVNIDKTKPTVSASRLPDANAHGWNNTDVTASASGVSDALSGIDAAASMLVDVLFSAEGAGQSATFTAVDKAGNSSTATVNNVNIDKTKPIVNIILPAAGTNYLLNSATAANYNCADSSSGVNTCSGDVANGANINTSSINGKTFTVTATDKAGNVESKTINYHVVFNWRGFFQPVDMMPVVNRAQAGSAIPVKFSLSGFQGMNIFAAGYPAALLYPCSSTDPSADVEQTVAATSNSLNYDPTADQYNFVWKTDKAWASKCIQLVVRYADGTERRANFQFRK